MKNKKGKTTPPSVKAVKPAVSISKMGKKIIFAGIALLALGFFVLTKTDPAGQNFASTLSPFLILGGYALIGIGIIFPEKKPASSPVQ